MVVYKSCPQMLRKHTAFLVGRRGGGGKKDHTVDAQMWAGDQVRFPRCCGKTAQAKGCWGRKVGEGPWPQPGCSPSWLHEASLGELEPCNHSLRPHRGLSLCHLSLSGQPEALLCLQVAKPIFRGCFFKNKPLLLLFSSLSFLDQLRASSTKTEPELKRITLAHLNRTVFSFLLACTYEK